MLGFRRNPLSRRKRESTSSSLQSHYSESNRSIDDVTEETPDPKMSVVASNNQAAFSKNTMKSEFRVGVDDADSASVSSNEMTTIQTQSSWKIGRVFELSKTIRSKIVRELEDVTTTHFETTDLESYLEFIAHERLVHMPRKGSSWDKILKDAEWFSLQLSEYAIHLKAIIPESSSIRDTALTSCRLLLELGHDQAEALEPTFNAFYELGLLLAHTIRLQDMFTANDAIKQGLSRIFASLVQLVGDVALYYRQRINRIYNGSVTIDFDAEFGSHVSSIWSQKERLFNDMWSYKLRNKKHQFDIAALRHHLLPTKESVKSFVYGRVADRKLRVDGTCEWIEHDLHDFLGSDDDIFTVTGSEGCGKSMLAAFVRGRLERPINRTQFEAISYTFSCDIPEEAEKIPFLKSLLSQILELNVGDVPLFERLSTIFEGISPGENREKLEADLWEALDLSLAAINNRKINVVIVIDGLDEIQGGNQNAGELHKRLHASIRKLPKVQAVTFSRPISHLGGSGCKHLVITPDHVRDDIELFLASNLRRNAAFASENDQAKRNLVNQLADQAKGSFLFAYLAINLFQTGLGFNAFKDTISHCKSDVKAVIAELMKRVNIKEEYGESKTYNLFIFMIAAQRPLTTGEMTDLMGVSLSKRTVSAGADIWAPIRLTQGLTVIHRGTLRFKHSSVRKYVHNLCGNTLMSIEDAHRHLTMALTLFAKLKLTYTCEPSLEPLPEDIVQDSLHSHHIVRYMMRHWTTHFRSSSLCGQNGKLTLTTEFKECVPDSIFFALFEWSQYQTHFGTKATIERHELSLRIRSACFGEKHRAYLQNLIILGNLNRRANNLTSASEFFYKASCTGQVVLYKFSPLVVSCTNLFLITTESMTFSERTTTVTYREEMIKFMIEICRGKNGNHSDAVIKWTKLLAKLYVDIKEEEKAMLVYKELHAIVTIRHGKGSKESDITEDLAGMDVVLKRSGGSAIVEQSVELIFEATAEMSYTDVRRIKIIMSLASNYEKHKQYVKAERLLLGLWRSILEASRLNKLTAELHVQKLNIAIEYTRFLKRINRTEEASNIMVCLWAEYENYKFEDEAMVIRFKELAVLAKSFGIVSVSMSILSKVWGWFKERKTIEHKEAVATATIITEVVEEITETTEETRTTTTVVETVTREVWETTFNRCKGGKVNKSFFSSCWALTNLYLKLENWAEVEIVTRKALEVTWKGVLTADAKLTIEGEFVSERIRTAKRLALCYHRQRQFDRAEEIYLRIFNATFGSLRAEDSSVLEAAVSLVEFYEDFHRHEKVVEIYTKLLQHYRKTLKADHELTVKTMYKLAAVYLKLGRKEAYEKYNEIVSIYSHNGCCHAGGLDAAIIVMNHYHLEKRWTELQKICSVLWTTFVHHNREIKFTEEMVERIYERYSYVMQYHAKVDFQARYKLTLEYRETVTKVFGASAAIVIKAMISLAEVCEGSEEHYHESVKIYEEVLKRSTTTTTISETTIKTMKRRMSKLYVTVVTTGKVTTTATVERAISVGIEAYNELRIELGWWHETTLAKLKEVTLLYKKLGTKEAHSQIVLMLQTSVMEIISTVDVSMTLHTAAMSLANIYIASGMVRHGHDLLRQLRSVMLFPGFEGGEKDVTIKISRKISKVSLVFLISFEQALTIDSKVVYSYSEIMADVLLETILYEQYMSVMSTYNESTNIEIVVEHAARLRFVWESRGRAGFVAVLDKKLFSLFTSRYSKFLGHQAGDNKAVFDFYVGLLREIGEGIAAERDTVDFGAVTCKAAYTVVRKHMVEEKDISRGHEVAKVAFNFTNSQRFYHSRRNNAWGYRLAELLAGVGVENWKFVDANVRDACLATSRGVLQSVLTALKEGKIELITLRFEDLSSVIYLLGEQQNYTELENILASLWQSREVQRTWSPDTVLNIGSLLVNAHVSANHLDQAITLCDTLYYNVRQSRGGLDAQALDFANRLCQLLRRASRLRDAARVHQDVVCDLDEHLLATSGAEAQKDERLRAAADVHLDGMRRCGWASRSDSLRMTGSVYERLKGYGKLNTPTVQQWAPLSAADEKREVNAAVNWQIEWRLVGHGSERPPMPKRNSIASAKERWGCWSQQSGLEMTSNQMVY